MNTELEIQVADLKDASEILDLQYCSYQSEAKLYNDYSIQPLTQTLEELNQEIKHKIVLKCIVNEGRIIGSVRAFQEDGSCFIGKLIVHPDYQNKGIGTKLMQEIEKWFTDVNRFELFTGHNSKKNLYLYQKLGYRIFTKEKVAANLELFYLEKMVT